MKKSYTIRIEENIYEWVKSMGTNFTTGIEFLHGKDKSASADTRADMEYQEFVGIFRMLAEHLKKYKDSEVGPILGIGIPDIIKETPVIDKIQKLNNIAKGKTLNAPNGFTKVWNNKDYQDANMLFGKIKIGLKKNNGKMQDNDGFDCARQKRVTLEGGEHLIPLLETMIK